MTEITHDTPLDAPAEKVWEALSDPAIRDRWLAPAQVSPRQGGPIDVQVIESEPPRRLRVAWRSDDGAVQSEVTFTVTPREAGSHLRIVHSGLATKPAPAVASLRMAA